ncbi:DUF2497 domain-containing protein [Oricola sp.]|uniref:DUF2497 domain-containing protein n=1 Tax=Oricola sp. TaxID=1979950 RepID=UPI003BAD19B2
MAQSNALSDKPSMDELLASIRRIIDAEETVSEPADANSAQAVSRLRGNEASPEQIDTVPPPADNDQKTTAAGAPRAMPTQQPQTRRIEAEPKPESDIVETVARYMQQERERAGRDDEKPVKAPDAGFLPVAKAAAAESRTPDIQETPARANREMPESEAPKPNRQAKYNARFSPEDDGAFKKVGSTIRGSLDRAEPGFPAPRVSVSEPAKKDVSLALTSETVSRAVSRSFDDLSGHLAGTREKLDGMAEDLLRDMLQEWLDNNLPAIVERLVRTEIERIARGDRRTA